MSLTFAETHNMVAYLSKSDASEGFNQILDFLNGSFIKLQALVDKKKAVVTEATIREALRLDDEDGVDCLPNEEIFAEFARMGYEKPSTKLTFLLKLVEVSNTHNFRVYECQKRVGKGFSGVETPLFESMLVEQQVDKEGNVDENVEEVNAGDAAEGDDSAGHAEVPTVAEEPSISSRTPPTPPPQPPQDIPSTSQVQPTPPQSPQLKRRVKKLERRNKVRVLKLKRLQKVRTSQRVETSDETVMDDESNQGRMIVEVDVDTDVGLEDVKEAADEAKEVAEDAKEDKTEPAEVQEVVDVITTTKLITKVVAPASETIIAASAVITTDEAQVPAATTAATLTAAPARIAAASIIDHVKIKAKEDPAVKKYQAMKRKPQTEGQARKKMMLYLKNVAGFKMGYFNGISYDDIHPIFKAKFNSNVAFLLKTKEQIEEDENKALQKLNETPAERAAKRGKLDEEIITFTSTKLILLVERKYSLIRFTLDQMLNAIRLEVKEESEVSLELLRFIRQHYQEGQHE
nr:hypothetical protein [Tanacetum cinerariifolium]